MEKKRILTISLAILSLISSCNGEITHTPSPESLNIISLRENLPILEMEANKWKSDAYLLWADIELRQDYPEGYPVMAGAFSSPSSEYEGLLVYFTVDGILKTEVVEHEKPVYQQEPITLEDWTIDSQEALDMMLDQDGLEFIKSKGNKQCSILILERLLYKPEQPVVWRLTLMECLGGDYVRHILLDPITGEFLEND
jgi:hypothetical protein